jgi:hypothetical protein
MVYGWGAHGLDQFVCARLLDKMFGASIPTVKEKTIDDYHTMQGFSYLDDGIEGEDT